MIQMPDQVSFVVINVLYKFRVPNFDEYCLKMWKTRQNENSVCTQ